MDVIINISEQPKGFGTVTGAGVQLPSTEVILTATAADPTYPFLYFLLEDGSKQQSPYTFITPAFEIDQVDDTLINIISVFDYQLRVYLQSQIFIELEESSITGILVARELSPYVQLADTTKRLQELSWADCIRVIITCWGEHTEKMQGWSSTRKLNYRKSLIDMMNNIYAKYGEDVYGSEIVSRSHLW